MRESSRSIWKVLILAVLAVLILFCSGREAEAAVAPSANAGSITAAGYSAGVIRVKGSVPTKVKSKDTNYYLFEVNAYTDELVKKVATVKKATSFTIRLKTKNNAGFPVMKYALAVKTGKGTSKSNFTRISPTVYVKNPEKAATVRTAYKYPATKKGLQSANLNEQTATKSKNCFINMYISEVTNGGYCAFKYDGVTYYFNDLWHYRNLVSSCNQKGISVTAQVLLDGAAPADLKAASGSAPFYGFRINTRKSRMKMDAIFTYLSQLFGSDDCYISNWILGNEVNSCSQYWYMGSSVSEDKFINNYANCFRSFYNAIRGVRGSSKVFICLEHCWTMRNSYSVAFPGKSVLQKFNAKLNEMQKGIRWNLAYHAYPCDLRVPSFWNDGVSNSADSAIVSPKNLKFLTTYIRNTYGKDTRILISEIGFNSCNQTQETQAAALALAYDIAACDPMIDGFFVRAYRDEPSETAQGLAFGMKGRKAFNVFKYMDTKSWKKYTDPVLTSVLGSGWKSRVQGFKASALYGMYTLG